MDDDRRVSEAEAQRLWQRAAELQAEAARRLEERSRTLARGDEAGDELPGGDYRLAHVRQAAVEAGISAEFMELALAEAEGGTGPLERSRADVWADRFLGGGPRALVATRTFEAPAEEVYGAMQRVFPRYQLSLVDTRGGEPLEGGVLVFELPSLSGMETTDRILKDLHFWADVRELHVRLQRLGDDRCEVMLRAPLGYARKLNLGVGGALAGGAGIMGSLIAGAIMSPLIVMMGLGVAAESVALVLAVALGFGGGSATGTWSMRRLFRWGMSKGQSGLDRLLQALAVDLRTGGVFQPRPGPAGGTLPPAGKGPGGAPPPGSPPSSGPTPGSP